MADDVGAPFKGAAKVGRRERVVDDERNCGLLRNFRDGLHVRDDPARIGETLDEDRLAAFGQRTPEILGIALIDETTGPAELFEAQAELRERAAIEIARGDEFVAGLEQREKGEKLR